MSPSTAMLIFTLLHTSAVNNDRRPECAEDADPLDACSKFTPRKEIRELSTLEILQLVSVLEKFGGYLNSTSIADSLDSVLISANLSFSFPYWDFRLDSVNPFESAFLFSMERSRLSTTNELWLSKLLFESNTSKDAELQLDSELRALKQKAQQWIQVLQFGNIWQAMLDVMIEELIENNGTESYDIRSRWLYQDKTTSACYGKTKIGGKCSSSEMCYHSSCVKGYCRSTEEPPIVTTPMSKTENETVAKRIKADGINNDTVAVISTTALSVPKVQQDDITPTTQKPSSKSSKKKHKHRHSSQPKRQILKWNDSTPFTTVYISVTIVQGNLRNKKRTKNRAQNYTIQTVGGNSPVGYDHILEGRPMENATNALIRVLNPEDILPFVEFRLRVLDKNGERCRQRCLSTRRKGFYRRCKRESVRLTMYESYSDPVQWYKTEEEALANQWVGQGYYKKRKLDYLLFKCNP